MIWSTHTIDQIIGQQTTPHLKNLPLDQGTKTQSAFLPQTFFVKAILVAKDRLRWLQPSSARPLGLCLGAGAKAHRGVQTRLVGCRLHLGHDPRQRDQDGQVAAQSAHDDGDQNRASALLDRPRQPDLGMGFSEPGGQAPPLEKVGDGHLSCSQKGRHREARNGLHLPPYFRDRVCDVRSALARRPRDAGAHVTLQDTRGGLLQPGCIDAGGGDLGSDQARRLKSGPHEEVMIRPEDHDLSSFVPPQKDFVFGLIAGA